MKKSIPQTIALNRQTCTLNNHKIGNIRGGELTEGSARLKGTSSSSSSTMEALADLKVLPPPLEEPGGGLLLPELVVDGHEGLDDRDAGLPVKLVLLVVQGLGVGAALDGLFAEQHGV